MVTVDGKYEVDSDGKCVDKLTGGPDANQKCSFNTLYTECKPIYKQCSAILDITKCNTSQISPTNSKCLKIVDGYGTKINVNLIVLIVDAIIILSMIKFAF